MTNKYDDKLAAIVNLSKQVKLSEGDKRQQLVDEFRKKLNDLMLDGWAYALGKENEISEELLPKMYVAQRTRVIDDLQINLGLSAERYRGAPTGSKEDKDAISDYHNTFEELIRITGEIIGLDPDAELPDKLMPQQYVEYWLSGS